MLQEEQIRKLTKLKELLEAGVLSEDEFAKEKTKVLSSEDGEYPSSNKFVFDSFGETSSSRRTAKKRNGKTALWIILGCVAGLFLLIALTNLSSIGDSFDGDEIDFIRNMYNTEQYNDDEFLRTHCTDKMLKKLRDSFGYEVMDDDIYYATWLFSSGAQDDKYMPNGYYGDGVNESKILDITKIDDHWYSYTALDQGWMFTNWIYIIKSGNVFLIDDVKTVYEEFSNYPVAL